MNAAEKKVLHLASALFAVGLAVRVLPWGLPSIDSFEVGESVIVERGAISPPPDSIVDKVISDSGAVVQASVKKSSKKAHPKVVFHLPVAINRAGVDELCALKGVGPKLAEKIISFREAHGPFKNPSDLQKVPGIGKKKAESILQGVIFD